MLPILAKIVVQPNSLVQYDADRRFQAVSSYKNATNPVKIDQ